MNNDYIISILAEQRRQDFMAEAANDRLAQLATADRTPWWRRAGHAAAPEPVTRSSLRATAPADRDRCQS